MIATSTNIILKIKTITSTIIEIKISQSASIKELKESIALKAKIDSCKQKLIFHGKILLDSSPISEYKLEDNDVIHLIETNPQQSNGSNGQSSIPSSSNDTNIDPLEYLNYLQMLTQSLNTQNNLMNMFFNQDLLNNLYTNLHISDSFLHLLKRTNYNKNDSVETLTQSFNGIYDLIANTIQIQSANNSMSDKLFKISNTESNIQYQIGQWVDVLDQFEQWKEAQIIDLTHSRAHIHFIGWSDDLNEYIRLNSPRIALFRSHTIQSPFSRFHCPFPNKRDQNNLSSNVGQYFDKMNNMKDLIHFLNVLRDGIEKVLEEKVKLELKEFSYNTEDKDRERQRIILIMQLYPLMDRIGRLLLDYSSYLMHYCFNYFENNTPLFEDNVTSIQRGNNSNETDEELLKQNIIQFEKFTQLCPMRNPGELAETFRLIRPIRLDASENRGGGGANFRRQRENLFNQGETNDSPRDTYSVRRSNHINHPVALTNNRHLLNDQLRTDNRIRQEGDNNRIISNNNGNNNSSNNNRYQIDYLNEVSYTNTNRRFKANSINIIQQEKFSYVVYKKFPIKTYENFTQTFDEKPKHNLVISSQNVMVEFIPIITRINSTLTNTQTQSKKRNAIPKRKEKVVIVAKTKQTQLRGLSSNKRKISNNNDGVNKVKLFLGPIKN